MNPVQRITYHQRAWNPETQGTDRVERVWKLGLGPCGETVSYLYADVAHGVLSIRQVTNASHKTFHIQLKDIDGPILFEHP